MIGVILGLPDICFYEISNSSVAGSNGMLPSRGLDSAVLMKLLSMSLTSDGLCDACYSARLGVASA
jgi:hypothetical protein